jgi:alginate O-acetyltransferase complex protein AlgI
MGFLSRVLLFNENEPLIFTRFYFWAFFFIVLLVYSLFYKNKALRNMFLFFASLFFYYKTSGFFFFLLIFSTFTDYYIAHAINRSRIEKNRKIWLAVSVFINLSVLCYFKYAYFFVGTFNDVFRSNLEVVNHLASMSNRLINTHFDVSKIFLPVGISFFTFQTISYSVDVYRRKIKPVDNMVDFGFYVSFFPQLVAGPIVRAAEFIPQLYRKYSLNNYEYGYALFMILNGLIKKLLIGDYLAVNFIDRIFSNPSSFSGFENLMALYGYSIQVYCDFSGYTDIATGVALLLGFQLPVNFNSPYKARNVGDFWKRWHMSLSSWLKDYLYIPIGGNRFGAWRTNINLMLTMLLGGLWHGASWNFVIWGGINGIGLIVYKLWRKVSPYEHLDRWYVNAWKIFLTFNFITFTRFFFRGESVEKVMEMMHQIGHDFNWAIVPMVISNYKMIFLLMLAAYVIHWLPSSLKETLREIFIKMPVYAKVAITVVVVFVVYQSVSAELQPFIYFQF